MAKNGRKEISETIDIFENGLLKGFFVTGAWFYKTTHQCKGQSWRWFLILQKKHHKNMTNCIVEVEEKKCIIKI